jgi:hypothetical protein
LTLAKAGWSPGYYLHFLPEQVILRELKGVEEAKIRHEREPEKGERWEVEWFRTIPRLPLRAGLVARAQRGL